jgi:flagellar FliL protein
MAEQDTSPDGAESQGAADAKKGPRTGLIVALALVGATLGGGVGTFVLAPKIVGAAPAPAAADSAEHAPDEEGEDAEHGGNAEGEHAAGKIFKVENLIVNPAGSEGTRFLMTTVAFETGSEEADEKLRAREIEIRDRVIAILEAKTLATLTQAHARDSLKEELARSIAPVVGPKARIRVYLPQYVIQ